MRPLTFCLLACLSLPVSAHDLWIERTGNLHTLAYGHERSGHEGAGRLELRPETVKQTLCLDPEGRELKAERRAASLKGECAASLFLVSSGYWSKTPYGTKNLPKAEAGVVLESWYSAESVKRIERWGAGLARPQSRELELTPAANPLALGVGDKLRLRAWFAGQPAAGVTVAYAGKPRGVTDDQGYINVRLPQPGFQMLQASLERPLNDGKADKAIHAATLLFELP
jgi:nickel transport protein